MTVYHTARPCHTEVYATVTAGSAVCASLRYFIRSITFLPPTLPNTKTKERPIGAIGACQRTRWDRTGIATRRLAPWWQRTQCMSLSCHQHSNHFQPGPGDASGGSGRARGRLLRRADGRDGRKGRHANLRGREGVLNVDRSAPEHAVHRPLGPWGVGASAGPVAGGLRAITDALKPLPVSEYR